MFSSVGVTLTPCPRLAIGPSSVFSPGHARSFERQHPTSYMYAELCDIGRIGARSNATCDLAVDVGARRTRCSKGLFRFIASSDAIINGAATPRHQSLDYMYGLQYRMIAAIESRIASENTSFGTRSRRIVKRSRRTECNSTHPKHNTCTAPTQSTCETDLL